MDRRIGKRLGREVGWEGGINDPEESYMKESNRERGWIREGGKLGGK